MAKFGEDSGPKEQEQSVPHSQVPLSKYSRRVVLSTILGRSDGGAGLVEERVVVGGWVKSCREIVKKDGPKPKATTAQPQAATASAPPLADTSCSELLLTRMPLLRSITRIITGALAQKVDSLSDKPVVAVPVTTAACLKINDGSCTAHFQIFINSSVYSLDQVMPTGTSILVEGVIRRSSAPESHGIELVVEKVLHVGVADPNRYPLRKTRLSSGFLRLNSHLRPRTTTIASITRIRNGLTHASHTFFQTNGFLHVHMPVITSTSGGNASEMFQVTTLLSKSDIKHEMDKMNDRGHINLETVKDAIEEKSKRIEQLKRSDSNREALVSARQDLRHANELALELEDQRRKSSDTSLKVEKLDFSKDYFSRPAYLSMSAGLHLESYACALSSVYTLGPIFHAKKVQVKRQLAEMWMLEVNLAFAELEDAMNCAEDYLKFVCNRILENCSDDVNFTAKRIDKTCIGRIQQVGSDKFKRISYTEAVETLRKVDKKFKRAAGWGFNLSEEHESYLTNELYKQPVIIYDHPKHTKPFFLRLNDDKKTVASFDVIVPMVGALISGGQREERTEMISTRIQDLGLPSGQYEWYLDLRRHGTVKHSGFSVGLEHLVMFVVGCDDARDVIPFPRTSGSVNP